MYFNSASESYILIFALLTHILRARTECAKDSNEMKSVLWSPLLQYWERACAPVQKLRNILNRFAVFTRDYRIRLKIADLKSYYHLFRFDKQLEEDKQNRLGI